MKVQNLSIHRVYVAMSCGCSVTCDFKDKLCKEPFKSEITASVTGAEEAGAVQAISAVKETFYCDKHKGSKDRSMLEFVMAERMDEAIEDARRPTLRPVPPPNRTTLDGTEGASVEKVAAAGAARNPRRAPGVKQMVRSAEDMRAAGAQLDAQLAQSSSDEVQFDVNSNAKSLDQLLDDSDPTENKVHGLVIAEEE